MVIFQHTALDEKLMYYVNQWEKFVREVPSSQFFESVRVYNKDQEYTNNRIHVGGTESKDELENVWVEIFLSTYGNSEDISLIRDRGLIVKNDNKMSP